MLNVLPEYLTCATCVWGGRPDEDGLAECRRYPPEVHALADGAVLQLRPRLGPLNGCGEHGILDEDDG